MEAIQVFHNDQFGDIRTAGTPDQPMFCLADVCKTLDLIPSKVSQRLEDDILSKYPIIDTLGRTQLANFVNEDGLYDVILDSRKPEAKAFRKWVTSEVLPAIRKTGSFSNHPDMLDFQLPQTFSEALRLAANQSEQIEQQKMLIERTTVQNKRQSLELVQLAPKVDYFDTVLQSTSTYCTDQIAKELGTTAVTLNKKLAILDVQFRRGEQWVLTAKYVGKGYTKTKTYTHNGTDGLPKTVMSTVWTEAGRLFIHNLLKQQKSA